MTWITLLIRWESGKVGREPEGGTVYPEDKDGEICGDTYDHDVVIDHEGPEGVQWHCARSECGVEMWDKTPQPSELPK